MATLDQSLKEAMNLAGAVGVSHVDWNSGMMLGSEGGGANLDLEIASAGNTEVVRAKMNTVERLGLTERIQDILITLDEHYHLICLVDSDKGAGLFFYLVLDRGRANLALARRQLLEIEGQLSL